MSEATEAKDTAYESGALSPRMSSKIVYQVPVTHVLAHEKGVLHLEAGSVLGKTVWMLGRGPNVQLLLQVLDQLERRTLKE